MLQRAVGFCGAAALWLLCCSLALWPLAAPAQTPQPVNTTLYIKSATFALKRKVVDATGKITWPIVSRHASAELAQRAAWKLPVGSYQIDPPTYYLEVRPCPDFPFVGYCNDWVDARISVAQIRTTSRTLFVVPLPPTGPIP